MTDHTRNGADDSPHRTELLRCATDQAGNEPAPEHESAEQRHARTVLTIDGVACAAAAIGTVAIGPGSPLHIRCARAPLAAALGGTSALLLRSARRKPIRNTISSGQHSSIWGGSSPAASPCGVRRAAWGLRCRGRYRSMATPLLETMEIDMGVRPVPSQQRPAHQPILFPNFYSSAYSSMVGGHSPECTTARVIASQVKTDTDRPDAPAVLSPSRGHL